MITRVKRNCKIIKFRYEVDDYVVFDGKLYIVDYKSHLCNECDLSFDTGTSHLCRIKDYKLIDDELVCSTGVLKELSNLSIELLDKDLRDSIIDLNSHTNNQINNSLFSDILINMNDASSVITDVYCKSLCPYSDFGCESRICVKDLIINELLNRHGVE